MMELIREGWHTARKQHVCDNCRGLIVPGSRYRRAFLCDAGDHWEYREHLACSLAAWIVDREAGPYWGDDAMPRVQDFENEDFDTVRAVDPEVWAAVVPRRMVT